LITVDAVESKKHKKGALLPFSLGMINKSINSQSRWEGKEHCNGALFFISNKY
jgi:hypothetical protein